MKKWTKENEQKDDYEFCIHACGSKWKILRYGDVKYAEFKRLHGIGVRMLKTGKYDQVSITRYIWKHGSPAHIDLMWKLTMKDGEVCHD